MKINVCMVHKSNTICIITECTIAKTKGLSVKINIHCESKKTGPLLFLPRDAL